MQDYQIENIIALNKHAERLLAGLYDLTRLESNQKYQFLQQSEMQKKFKSFSKKTSSLPKGLNSHEVGGLLKRPYAILQHFYNFQIKGYNILMNFLSQNKNTLSLYVNYCLTYNIMTLYCYYIKIHLMFSQISDPTVIVNCYRSCYEAETKNDLQEFAAIYTFIHERETLKILESELQVFNKNIMDFFRTFCPVVKNLFVDNFPLGLFSISSLEKTLPTGSESFIPQSSLYYIYLYELYEWTVYFGIISSQCFSGNQDIFELFKIFYYNCVTIQIYGSYIVEIKTLFNFFKKFKDIKKFEYDLSFIDQVDAVYNNKIKQLHEFRRKKLILVLRDFISALQVDASIVCSKYFIGLSIIGISAFEIKNYIRLKTSKLTLQLPEKNSNEFIYLHTKLVSYFLNLTEYIQRFFVYNIREFDVPYLDSLVHSFSIPQTIYESLSILISALRMVDIKEYDEGTCYDFSYCLSLIYYIMTGFDRYSRKNGVRHLSPLTQLLSGVLFRINLYQNTFQTILNISKIGTLWHNLEIYESLANDSNTSNSKYNCVVLQLCHYHLIENTVISEITGISNIVEEHYQKMLKLICLSILSWVGQYKEVNLISDNNIIDNINKYKKDIFVSSKISLNVANTLLLAQEFGVVRICENEHNILKDINDIVFNSFNKIFEKQNPVPPFDLCNYIRITKCIIQTMCAASSLSFNNVMNKTMENVVFSENGLIKKYSDFYSQLIPEIICNSFYCKRQNMFLPLGKSNTIDSYFTNTAFLNLKNVIGTSGFDKLTDTTLTIISNYSKLVISQLIKIIKGNSKDYESGLAGFSDGEALLHNICNFGVILQIRRILAEHSNKEIPIPHLDEKLINILSDVSGINNIYDSIPKVSQIIASIFSLSYWEKFDFDPETDSMKDNSHLIGLVIDVIIGYGIHIKKLNDINDFYNFFFACILKSINQGREQFKSNKKVNYQGLTLLILVDYIIKMSEYANYSSLEQQISYQFIRSIYTDKISTLKDANKNPQIQQISPQKKKN